MNQIKQYILTELLPYLTETINPEEINLLANGLDSLKIMRLVNFIENNFHITIPDESIVPKNFATISDILTLISDKQKNHS
jgi:acyl carrier protein